MHSATKYDVDATIAHEYAKAMLYSKNQAKYHPHTVVISNGTTKPNGKVHADTSMCPAQMPKID